jgi:pimeloyl-ACP methyl ester carboxylesterase
MPATQAHTLYPVRKPAGWFLNVSHTSAVRLVVFVHGFGGQAVTTWDEFASSGRTDSWSSESDMLFVGYNSTRDGVIAVANRIREHLHDFYPVPHPPAMNVKGKEPREDTQSPYQELIFLGHSLGGLVARRAMADAAQEQINSLEAGDPPKDPGILDAKLRLFSPASAGFRPAGFLGLVRASGLWPALHMYLSRSSAYTDLQQESEIIKATKRRTEALAHKFTSLRANILWANPENVVCTERYDTDFVADSADGLNHRSVCKPSSSSTLPLKFGSTGKLT